MKNLKKVLALVVALTMVFTTVAFASYPDVDANADYAGAVELLSALEILKGDDNGNFNPDNTITRAEFAAVVCRALGWEASANGAKGATMFTDVAADHWASGYINLASQQGIVNGKGNGIFDPEGNVTFTEAVKMLVVAIGFEPMAAQKGGWPTGYLTVANSIKMTAGVAASGTDAAALRSTVAQLTANAIEIPVMDQVSYGTLTEYIQLDDYSNYKTLLSAMDVHKVTGVVLDIDEIENEFDFQLTMPSDDYEFGYNYNTATGVLSTQLVNRTFDVADSNVADFIGQNVNIYLKETRKDIDYEAIIAIPSGIGETLTVAIDKLTGTATISTQNANTFEYYESKDATRTTKVYVDANPIVKVNGITVNNGVTGNGTTFVVNNLLDSTFTGTNTQFTFTENDNDKYYDIIDITCVEYAIVETVLADKERIEFADGSKVVFDFEDDEQISKFFNAEGAEIALEDIAEGDVLAIEVGEVSVVGNALSLVRYNNFQDKITITNLGQSIVTGTVTGWDSIENILYIDGTEYEYSTLAWVTDDDYSDLISTGDPLGTDGAFYLGVDGKIIGYDGSQGVSGNYGFIVDAFKNTTSFEPQWQLKLLTAEGVVTYNVDTKCEINGTDRDLTTSSTAQDALNLSKYNNSTDAATALNRVVEYDFNKNGEIDEVYFLNSKANVKNHTISASTDEFKVATNKLGGKTIEADLMIFNVKTPDVDDATILDASVLVDEGAYGGVLIDLNNDKEMDLFVMTEGTSPFAADGNFFVVDSKVATTYGEDAEDATLVKYYVAGEKEAKTAIFTDDSDNRLNGSAFDVDDLVKGSVFVANVAEDGLVSEYAVIAKLASGAYTFNGANGAGNLNQLTKDIFGNNEVDTTKGDKAEFVYGYITNISGKTLTLGGVVDPTLPQGQTPTVKDYINGRDFTIGGGVAQYSYNTESQKAKIVVGDYRGRTVDVYDLANNRGNLVLLKVYDDEVTDIVSISAPSAGFGIKAQTHWTANQTPNLNAAEEVEVEVEVEDVVEVEDIVFE